MSELEPDDDIAAMQVEIDAMQKIKDALQKVEPDSRSRIVACVMVLLGMRKP